MFEKRIQNNPPVKIEIFENWGKTQIIPVISSSPKTLDELKRLIKVASEEKLRVRCAGTGHSWAPIFSDRNNLLIYMNEMESDYDGGSRIRKSTVSSMLSVIFKEMVYYLFSACIRFGIPFYNFDSSITEEPLVVKMYICC